ncbi:response regulator transcription factor [Faecalibacter rhinopitheci]|uniref:Response regulator transcription factor n=1 Tax=Faecalibacter rhinopitheci TaxID=2779678 RepID=A0A8J7FPV1_9FLAO|nr:response regulator transcription factor [Faecalibacter rhinopitheci]MBF0597269.1 response regulator transcription factor [Faecalibacter rhinopitheci]
MNIFIIDQHKIVIDGLIAVLNKKKGFKVVGYATNVKDAIEWISANPIDLVITEIEFTDEDAKDLIKTIKIMHREVKILILTGDNRIKKISELFKLGINGFIEKYNETKTLIKAIDCIKNGEAYMGDELRAKIIENFSNQQSNSDEQKSINEILASITNRELEIIRYICEGCNSKEISDKLFISFNTVETHRKRIFNKLQIKNSISLMRFALKHELIE